MNKQVLQKLISENKSSYQIAEELGKSQTTTRYWLKKYELTTVKILTKPECKECNIPLIRTDYIYCSNKCQQDYQYNEYIINWKQGLEDGVKGLSTSSYIKRFMLIKYDYKCSECSWNKINPYTNKIPLELEHIDGDYTNNTESNLTILCPNCHSLTATYKGANKNGTRTKRQSPALPSEL